MTMKQISRLNYILGRIEGIASGVEGDAKDALLDTAEWLDEFISEAEVEDG